MAAMAAANLARAATGLQVANPANLPKAAADQVTIMLPRLLGLLGIIMAPWALMTCLNLENLILMARMMISMILMMMTIHLIQGKTSMVENYSKFCYQNFFH